MANEFDITARLLIRGPSASDLKKARSKIEKALENIRLTIAVDKEIVNQRKANDGSDNSRATKLKTVERPPRRPEIPRENRPPSAEREAALSMQLRPRPAGRAPTGIRHQEPPARPVMRANPAPTNYPAQARLRKATHRTSTGARPAKPRINHPAEARIRDITNRISARAEKRPTQPRINHPTTKWLTPRRAPPEGRQYRPEIPLREERPERPGERPDPSRLYGTANPARADARPGEGRTPDMTVASAQFLSASTTLAQSMTQFAGNSTTLTTALNNFPRSVAIESTNNHEVNINGAEALSALLPALKEMVIEQTNATLNRTLKRHLPEAGVPEQT